MSRGGFLLARYSPDLLSGRRRGIIKILIKALKEILTLLRITIYARKPRCCPKNRSRTC